MSDWSEAYNETAQARSLGFELVVPFAGIVLMCPDCAALMHINTWKKHMEWHVNYISRAVLDDAIHRIVYAPRAPIEAFQDELK